MADLGALSLILGADISPLEASLGRADELINRSATQMQKSFGKAFKFKVEVGDLAVQLTQAEGVVDRSIRQVRTLIRQPIKFNIETGELNVQLTETEALINRTLQDIKAMDRSIAFNLSVRGLDDVEGLVARSIQQMSALSNSVLTVQVDDKRLTELNQHLDAKQAHYARVQQQFATPLKVLVDDSQLTTLNQHLTATEQHLSSVAGKFAATKLTPAIDLTNLNLLDRRLNGSIDNLNRTQSAFNRPIVTNVDTRQILELENLLDHVERPHKLRLDLPDTIGGLTSAIGKLVLSPVTIPLKIAQNSLEGIFRGMSEGLGRELTRNFSKGFSSSIEGFVQKRTGMSTKEMGEQSGKYVATRGKIGAEYISQELGYKDGLRGVGNDLKTAGSSVDTVLRNPRRAVRKIENKLVEALEYYQEGETDKAMNVVTESFAPMGKLARRAAGVGIRAAAQPIRIRNRAMLKGKAAEAEELAKNIEIEGYDREAADKAEAIHIVTGGLDFNNGENAHFAGGLLKQQYPKAHTITHVNKKMNQPVKRGEGVVGGMMGMMEQLQKMGGKEGKIGDMPIQKLAEMAIDLGYNPDGLEMYAKAVKIRQAHPDKPINFMGTSGGVDAVNYATALAERAGMKNVRGVGLGLPMTNLTELASKRNFQSIVGTLDDLDIGYHNTDFLGAKRKADPASMAEIKKVKDEKFPFDMSGMFSVGKTQRHVLDGGKGHAIGNSYLGNDNVMGAVNDFIARPNTPRPEIRSDIKDAASLNNFYADKFNAKRKEIPLTIAALYKDPKALARIEADPNGKTGDYTYFSPANKNHDGDWLRINEFDGLIKDVRGQDIEGRSEKANSESKKKGLDKFIKSRREKAAKQGTTSIVAEHAAGWLDYLDLMKGGMEEYGKTGAMPYDALQKGAEYYPELRPLAAREQHKQSVTGTQRKSVDRIYQSGNLSEINRLRESHKLTPVDNNYGYKDALVTPDSYIKDLDKQRANTAAEIAKNQAEMAKLKSNSVKVANPIADEAQYNPFEDSAKQLKDKANRRKLQRSSSETKEDTFLNVGANPQVSKPATTDLPKEQPKDKFTAAVDKFDRAVDKFSTKGNTGQKVDLRPKVNTPAPPEYVEVGALQTLAADTLRGAGGLAAKTAKAGAGWLQNPIGQAVQSTAGEIGKTYRAVERVENLAFQVIPFAGAAKKAVTNVAAPMGLAYAAAQNPVIGGAVNGLMGMAGGSIGSIGHGIVDAGTSLMPFGIKNLFGAVGGGAVDLASTYGPALYGGKLAFNTGKEVLKKAFPGFSRKPDDRDAESRKQLDRSEVEEMKAAIQAELQALKNFQTLTAPDAPKITPAQDRAAQKTIADHTKEQEGKLNQKFDRLANNNPPKLEQPIATNVKSIDVGDANAIGSEVQRLGAVIRSNRKSIVSMLKSGNPEEVAKGLQQAEAFGYGLNVVRGDLEATRAKIAPAKITNPGDVKNLESSRKSIDGFLGSPGAQTAPIQEAVSKVSGDNNLVERVNPYLPAQARSSIFDRIKSALKPKPPNNNNNDAGFSQIEAVLASLIAATAIPLVGAPIAAPIAIGGGLIAALKKSAFAKSKLGQTRIPGLDFLDNPVKSLSETIGLTNRDSAINQGMVLGGDGSSTYTPEATKLQRVIANAKKNLTPVKQYITDYPTNARDNLDRLKSSVSSPIQAIKDKTQSLRNNPIEEIRSGMILAESETRKAAQVLNDRFTANWQKLTDPVKQQVEKIKSLAISKAADIKDRTQNLRDNPVQEVRAGLVLAESETRKVAKNTWQESRGKSYLDRAKSFIDNPNTQTIVESFQQDPIQTIKVGLIAAESQARNAGQALTDKLKANWQGLSNRVNQHVDQAKSFVQNALQKSGESPTSDKDSILENARSRMLGRSKWQFLMVGTKYASRPEDAEALEPDPIPPTLPNGVTPPPPKNPLTPAAEVGKSESALTKLTNVGKLALGVFGGFTLASLAVPAMIALGKSTLDTAKNFETLQVKLAAASDSAQSGRNSFARITAKADELGVSRSGALEVGAGIAGTTFGTELEGLPSDVLTDKTLQFFKSRGLNKQQQEGFQLAATQTLGRKNLSGQEVNQFIQSASITDTRSIAARGMGLTPAQFAAMQDGPGIDSKKFMQAFLSQGVQDARTGEAVAMQTAGYKESQLSAKTEVLSGSIGAGISPVYKAGVDLLTSSIGLLNTAIELGKSALIGFAINGLLFAGAGLVKLAMQFGLPGVAMATFKSLIVANASQIGAAMVKMGVQFAAFYVLGEGVQLLGKKWSNSAQEIEDSANKITTALSKLSNDKTPDLTKPKTAADVGGDGFLDSALLFAQRKITQPIFQKQQDIGNAIVDNPFSVGLRKTLGITAQKPESAIIADNKQKEDQEIRESIDKVSYNTKLSIGASEKAGQKGKQMAEVDLAISRLDSERSGLYTSGSPDAGKIADLNKRYNEKFKERTVLDEDTAPAKAAAQESINAIKGAQAFLDKKNEGGQIGQDTYIAKTAQLKIDLKAAEDAQRKLNDAIKSGFDNLLPWTTSLDKIVASFDDIKTKADESAAKLSIGRNNLERGGNLTKGEAEYQGSIDKQSNIQTQIKQTAATIKELRAALLTKDEKAIENVQKNYGVDDSTSGTQLRLKADKATSVVDKEILSKLAIIKDKEINLTGMQSQLSDARTEMYRRIEQENRDAMLYYVGLAKQIDPQGTAFTKAIAQVTQEKNKLLSKLQGYGNGMFDGYIGAILDLFDSSKKKLEALAQYANTRKSAIDGFNDRAYQAESTARTAFNAPGQQSGAASNYPAGQSETAPSQPSAPTQPNPTSHSTNPTSTSQSTSPSEVTRSHPNVKPQIDAALRRLTPEERNRYLNTTLSVDGKTDLGLDDYDRNVLGLKDRPKSKPSIPPAPTPRSSISPSPVPQSNSQFTPVSAGSPKVGRVQPIAVGTWVQQSQAASQKILEQELQRGQTQLDTAFSDVEFQQITNELKAKREGKRSEQQVRRTARTQQRSLTGLKTPRTIQEKQEQELKTFENSAADSKEDFATFRQNMTDSVGDLYTVIKYLDSRTDLDPGQKKTLADAKARAARLSGTLKTVNTNFGQIDDKVKAARERMVEQQGYDRDVAVEQTGIKERETKRSGIEAQRTGVQQTLRSQPFNSSLNASDRQLEEDSQLIAIQNEEIQALRALIEQERSGSLAINRSPAQVKAFVAAQQVKIRSASDKKRKNLQENSAQKSKDYQFSVDTENRGFDAGKLQQEATGFDIGSRRQTALDRTDAPFANNNSIDRVYTRKIKELDLEQATADRTLIEKQKKYKGDDALLGRASQEFTEAKRQIELKRSTATVENNADTADRERSRRGVLYGNQVANFDSNFAIVSAQTQQKKLMGQDTREQDYQSQKLSKQKEFSQKEFDLTQQRSQITALTPEANAARAQIDGLLTNLKALESIELSNLSAQFNQLNQVVGETQKATSDVFKSFLGGGAFDFKKLLRSPFLAFGNQMVDKLVPDLFSGLYQKSPQAYGPQQQQQQGGSGGDILSQVFGWIGGLFGGKGYATGGIKGGLATISNGIIGSGRSQVDNRLAIVEDGEGVLTHLGVDTIGGASGLAKINRGIKIPMFASGGIKGANYSTPRPNTNVPNLTSNATSLSNVSANVTINNSDGKSSVTSKEDGTKLARLINNAISTALIREQRAGGLLYS